MGGSIRHTRRILAAYREKGAAALARRRIKDKRGAATK